MRFMSNRGNGKSKHRRAMSGEVKRSKKVVKIEVHPIFNTRRH